MIWFRFLMVAVVVLGLASCKSENPISGENLPPKISAVTASPDQISYGEMTEILCSATDPNGDPLTYKWEYYAGSVIGSGKKVHYASDACCGGSQTLTVIVSDGRGGVDTGYISIRVR